MSHLLLTSHDMIALSFLTPSLMISSLHHPVSLVPWGVLAVGQVSDSWPDGRSRPLLEPVEALA